MELAEFLKSVTVRRSTGVPAAVGALRRRRFLPIALHLPLVVLVALTFLLTDDPETPLYVGGCLILPGYLAIAIIEAKRAPTLLSPLSFYFAWQGLALGAGALSIAQRMSAREAILLASFEVIPDHLASAYVLTILGSFSLHLGIQILRPLKQQARRESLEDGPVGALRYPVVLVSLWLLGVIVRLTGNPSSSLGAIFGVAIWASNAALCAYALSASTSKVRPRMIWWILGVGVLIEFVLSLQTFSKAYIMYSLVPILWTCAYVRALRKWLVPMGLALAAFYFLIVSPVVLSAREQGGLAESETYRSRLFRVYEQSSMALVNVNEQVSMFWERQFDPIPAGFIYGEVERYGFRYGDTMEYLKYAFVPRLLWPEKPDVSRGLWFTVYLGQASREDEATTSTGQTAAGELYWNFGIVGVVLGMLVLGALIGLLWRIAGERPQSDPLRMVLYFCSVFAVVDTGEVGASLVMAVHRLLVLGVVIAAWDWKRNYSDHGGLATTLASVRELSVASVKTAPR